MSVGRPERVRKAEKRQPRPKLNSAALTRSTSQSRTFFLEFVILPILIVMSSSSSSSSTPSIPSTGEVKDELVQASKKTLSSFRSLAAGGVGGVFAVIVGHPFDLVKVRMQTSEKGVYTGAIDVVKKSVAREGLRKVRG